MSSINCIYESCMEITLFWSLICTCFQSSRETNALNMLHYHTIGNSLSFAFHRFFADIFTGE